MTIKKGLPSIHTMVSFTLTSYFFFAYLHLKGTLPIQPLYVLLGVLWVFQVGLSRLYLGVHSPLDLAGGITIGSLLCSLWLRFGDIIDDFLISYNHVELFAFVLVFILVTLHPCSVSTPSFSRAVVMVGLALGTIIGSHVHYSHRDVDTWVGNHIWNLIQYPLQYLHQSSLWKSLSLDFWRILIRLISGFLVLNFSFLLSFRVLFVILCKLFSAPGVSHLLRLINQLLGNFTFPSYQPVHPPPVKVGKKESKIHNLPADPITWSKFLSSFVIAILVTQTIPSLFLVMDKEYFVT